MRRRRRATKESPWLPEVRELAQPSPGSYLCEAGMSPRKWWR